MELVKTGSFRIEESFNISSMGIVIVGHSSDTQIRLGLFVNLDINNIKRPYKIKGIQVGNNPEDDFVKFGLLLDIEDQTIINYLAENKIKGQTVDIFSAK